MVMRRPTSARRLGRGDDCADGAEVQGCADFMEWNARSQITTWAPTPAGASKVPSGPVDYAAKHWSGLIGDYYVPRVELIVDQASADAARGRLPDRKALDRRKAELAHRFQTSKKRYPTAPVGDPILVSRAMHDKYTSWFSSCVAAAVFV